MIVIAILLGLTTVGALVLAGKNKRDYYEEAEEAHRLQEELDASKMVLQSFKEIHEERKQLLVERDLKLKSLAKFLQEGVFYDVENDTIVLVENLEKIGELNES